MSRCTIARSCFLAFAMMLTSRLLLAQAPPPSPQSRGSVLAKYITPEAFAAVVAYPMTIAELPEMELAPREIVSATATNELGFDPLDLEEVLLFVEPPKPGEMAVEYCAVLRFTNGVDSSGLLPRLEGAYESKLIEGKAARVSHVPGVPSFLALDAKTVFLGSEAMLAKALKPATQVAPLSVKLRTAEAEKAHLLAVMMLPPVRETIADAVSVTPPLPQSLEALKQLPELLEQVELRVNVNAAGGLKVSFSSSEKESAERVKSILTAAMIFGEEAFLSQLRQGIERDAVQAAAATYAQRMTDHFHQMLEPKLQGKVVSIEVKNGPETQFALMGIGASALLPAVEAAREAARRQVGANNLKQIALAMHNYHDVNGQFPDQGVKALGGKPGISWRVHLLPFMGEQALYEQFHLDEPWDSEHNKILIDKMPACFRAEGSKHTNKTNYLAPLGEGGAWASGEKRTFANITDGTSNTIMAVEASDDRAVIWTKPDDYEIDPKDLFAGLVGLRQGGFQVAFFDGSVRFISQNVDEGVLKAMFTMAGAEPIKLP